MANRNNWAADNAKRSGKGWRAFCKVLVCVAFLAFLTTQGYRLIQGFQHWRRNKEIKLGYVEEVERLKQHQQQQKEEIHKLEHNLLAQEKLAREMGYIKQGETVYKFVPKSQE